MAEIKRELETITHEFGLESYLAKPKRDNIEAFTPSFVDTPSFSQAETLDKNGEWREAANHYFTLFSNPKNPFQKAEAFIDLSQMFINLVNYIQARKFLLENKDIVLSALSGWDKTFFEAQVHEKLGWINDYLGETEEGMANFSHARELLSKEAKTDDKVLRVYETSNHFLGRQRAILAWQSINTEANVKEADERFRESIKVYEALRAKGKPDDAAEGFQYGWLARINIIQGNFREAQKNLEKMKYLFDQAKKERPGSGILGYYYLVSGRFEFEQGNYDKARSNFTEALRINTEVVNYPSSQADAILGMALCDYIIGNKDKAREEAEKALSINPNILYRGYI